jgi:hypothetical protein
LPKLQVIDSIFLSDIDSLILTSECSVLKKGNYKYFGIGTYPIKSDTILFELIELPVSDSTAVGYFEYRNYIFFVQNSFDKTLFKKTKQRKKFTYKRGKLAVVEDFPLWVCLYNKRRLILLEEYTW